MTFLPAYHASLFLTDIPNTYFNILLDERADIYKLARQALRPTRCGLFHFKFLRRKPKQKFEIACCLNRQALALKAESAKRAGGRIPRD